MESSPQPTAPANEPRLFRLHGLVTDVGYLLAAFGLIGMAGLYCMEVVLRYFLNAPTRWSLEVISFLMLIMMFLAVPHAVRSGMHIAVTLLADLYPGQVRRIGVLLNLIGFIVCAFVAAISLRENIAQQHQLIETMGNVVLPKWWLSAFITYGFANSALWYVRLLLNGGRPIAPVLAIVPRPSAGAAA
jgi:TRAP-type C4-dicarboxylate transport system permease small subunit